MLYFAEINDEDYDFTAYDYYSGKDANFKVVLTGDYVVNASRYVMTKSEGALPEQAVSLEFTSEGQLLFEEATGNNIGKPIYIFLDTEILSAPTVNEKITGGNAVITGSFDVQYADELAALIRAGALPFALDIIYMKNVGAKLGSDAMSTSITAGIIGICLVVVFMLGVYKFLGLTADFALLVYIELMMLVLSAFKVTLTLPGIAGIILSVGMAVDANVIIFERIREELGAGKTLRASIDAGFKRAFPAIFDGNVTTLIAAAVLFWLGSGSVRGFAQTLSIGVILSMFTALQEDGRREFMKIIENRKKFFLGSALVMLLGLVIILFNGFTGRGFFNLDVEFSGGLSMNIDIGQDFNNDDISQIITEITEQAAPQLQRIQGTDQVAIKIRSVDAETRIALVNAISEKYAIDESSFDISDISATVSGEMQKNAIKAIAVACVLMLLYVSVRFKGITMGGSAILTIVHDALFTVVCYGVLRIPINNSFIAVILTIIGYAVNNNIVVLDRIRENKKILRRMPFGDVSLLSAKLNVSPMLARVLINRGIKTLDEANAFLKPNITFLEPIINMHGVLEAYKIIKQCIENKEKICIYGDYDVDGVMSTVILYKSLLELEAVVTYYIPEREGEGYGLNIPAIEKLYADGCSILISCDNGIASVAEVLRAKELGMKVIIIDHHEPGEKIPEADAVIDPKQKNCPYKFKQMCAAGIVFRFVIGMYEYLKKENSSAEEYISLAAIATFCDIVDLHGENRIIAKSGLEVLNRNIQNLGLKLLIKERSLLNTNIGEFEIGYIIGECINATGRLERASIAVELFMTKDTEYAHDLAIKLIAMNEERKKMTASAFEKALETLNNNGKDLKVVVIYDEDIHESIAGIVAGRIKDKLHHPVIVLTNSSDFSIAKGSARSIDGYNIFEALSKQADLFERFGGHAMAAGMSLKKENIKLLENALNEDCSLLPDDFIEKIIIDKQLELSDVTFTLAKELCLLKPFGKGNKEPLFGSKGVEVTGIQIYAEKNTIRFTFKIPGTHRKLNGICFGKLEEFSSMIYENFNEYNAQKILSGNRRMSMLDLKEIIRTIPDFPEEGVMFRDITTVLQNPDALKFAIDKMADVVKDLDFDLIAGPESRGFIFGVPLSYILGKGFIPVRKAGKLPYGTISKTYSLEYGKATVEIHKDAILPGQKIVIIDDLLATGGTCKAIADLITEAGGQVVGMCFLIELLALCGRELNKVIKQKCSGITIFGKTIHSILFTTDIAIICNNNADAIIAVYPFTPHPAITQAIMTVAQVPVLCGVGGGTTQGLRSANIALHAEFQGAIAVVLNAPAPSDTVRMVKETVDIPVVVTVVSELTDISERIKAGTDIINVSGGAKTPMIVKKIREIYNDLPIIATGGPTTESITETIKAGANAITYTPPTNGELFKVKMEHYRNEEHEKLLNKLKES
ncbi:single-stranded-dna-specific exonuclease recj [Holotrichia oblita]|nr:single-stranded-dna-specific exonuclease recj [Holotrichia oblita]